MSDHTPSVTQSRPFRAVLAIIGLLAAVAGALATNALLDPDSGDGAGSPPGGEDTPNEDRAAGDRYARQPADVSTDELSEAVLDATDLESVTGDTWEQIAPADPSGFDVPADTDAICAGDNLLGPELLTLDATWHVASFAEASCGSGRLMRHSTVTHHETHGTDNLEQLYASDGLTLDVDGFTVDAVDVGDDALVSRYRGTAYDDMFETTVHGADVAVFSARVAAVVSITSFDGEPATDTLLADLADLLRERLPTTEPSSSDR